MMLALGMFVFMRQTLPHQTMQRESDYRWYRQIPVSVNGMPTSFSALARKTSRLPVCFIPN